MLRLNQIVNRIASGERGGGGAADAFQLGKEGTGVHELLCPTGQLRPGALPGQQLVPEYAAVRLEVVPPSSVKVQAGKLVRPGTPVCHQLLILRLLQHAPQPASGDLLRLLQPDAGQPQTLEKVLGLPSQVLCQRGAQGEVIPMILLQKDKVVFFKSVFIQAERLHPIPQ